MLATLVLVVALNSVNLDVFHLPGVQRSQFGAGALGTERDTGAIFTSGIDSHRDTLLPVCEYLDHTAIYEYPQLQRLVGLDADRRRFGGP